MRVLSAAPCEPGAVPSNLICVKAFVALVIMIDLSPIPNSRALTMLQSCASPECTVFVVDDDDSAREALKCFLEAEGFAVRIYSSAKGFLREVEVPSNSCLVTDYHMPGMDGLELVDELRLRGNSIPAILITGDANPHVRDRAAAARVPVIERLNSVNSVVECIQAMVKSRVN
jgi:FixJ family two-component response regulator